MFINMRNQVMQYSTAFTAANSTSFAIIIQGIVFEKLNISMRTSGTMIRQTPTAFRRIALQFLLHKFEVFISKSAGST